MMTQELTRAVSDQHEAMLPVVLAADEESKKEKARRVVVRSIGDAQASMITAACSRYLSKAQGKAKARVTTDTDGAGAAISAAVRTWLQPPELTGEGKPIPLAKRLPPGGIYTNLPPPKLPDGSTDNMAFAATEALILIDSDPEVLLRDFHRNQFKAITKATAEALHTCGAQPGATDAQGRLWCDPRLLTQIDKGKLETNPLARDAARNLWPCPCCCDKLAELKLLPENAVPLLTALSVADKSNAANEAGYVLQTSRMRSENAVAGAMAAMAKGPSANFNPDGHCLCVHGRLQPSLLPSSVVVVNKAGLDLVTRFYQGTPCEPLDATFTSADFECSICRAEAEVKAQQEAEEEARGLVELSARKPREKKGARRNDPFIVNEEGSRRSEGEVPASAALALNPLDPPAQQPAPLLPTLLGPVANAAICGLGVHAANKPRSAEELAQSKLRRTVWDKKSPASQKSHIHIFGYDSDVPSDYVGSDEEHEDARGGYSHTHCTRLVCRAKQWVEQALRNTTAPPAWTPPSPDGDSIVAETPPPPEDVQAACGDDGLIWKFTAARNEWTRHEDNIYPGALAWTRWWPSLASALPPAVLTRLTATWPAEGCYMAGLVVDNDEVPSLRDAPSDEHGVAVLGGMGGADEVERDATSQRVVDVRGGTPEIVVAPGAGHVQPAPILVLPSGMHVAPPLTPEQIRSFEMDPRRFMSGKYLAFEWPSGFCIGHVCTQPPVVDHIHINGEITVRRRCPGSPIRTQPPTTTTSPPRFVDARLPLPLTSPLLPSSMCQTVNVTADFGTDRSCPLCLQMNGSHSFNLNNFPLQRLTTDEEARHKGWDVERSQWAVLEVDQDLRDRLKSEQVRQNDLARLSRKKRRKAANTL